MMIFGLFSNSLVSNLSSFRAFIFQVYGKDVSGDKFSDERRFRLILWSIIGGTRGGPNRAKILGLLADEPLNSNQISKKLNLDHKTIRHHLQILSKNQLITKPTEEKYDVEYTLTAIMKQNVHLLEEIVAKIRR